jgi:hypothetical protein
MDTYSNTGRCSLCDATNIYSPHTDPNKYNPKLKLSKDPRKPIDLICQDCNESLDNVLMDWYLLEDEDE